MRLFRPRPGGCRLARVSGARRSSLITFPGLAASSPALAASCRSQGRGAKVRLGVKATLHSSGCRSRVKLRTGGGSPHAARLDTKKPRTALAAGGPDGSPRVGPRPFDDPASRAATPLPHKGPAEDGAAAIAQCHRTMLRTGSTSRGAACSAPTQKKGLASAVRNQPLW
jgi:hypothetical protein